MSHNIYILAGSGHVLSAYTALHAMARTFALTSGASILALPVDDDLHDAFHGIYGTGEWLDGAPLLSTSDLRFAAEASHAGPLAVIETNYFGGAGYQAAAVWKDGAMALGPAKLNSSAEAARPRSLWPINAALRSLGVAAAEGRDEFETFGLGFYRSNEDIWSMAAQVPVRG